MGTLCDTHTHTLTRTGTGHTGLPNTFIISGGRRLKLPSTHHGAMSPPPPEVLAAIRVRKGFCCCCCLVGWDMVVCVVVTCDKCNYNLFSSVDIAVRLGELGVVGVVKTTGHGRITRNARGYLGTIEGNRFWLLLPPRTQMGAKGLTICFKGIHQKCHDTK